MSVSNRAKLAVRSCMRRLGYDVIRVAPGSLQDLGFAPPPKRPADAFPWDFDDTVKAIWEQVRLHTMTSKERVFSLVHACEYVVRAGIPGDLVECGVWKGGSAMAMALALLRRGETSRRLYLYDTYDEGWPEGKESDARYDGVTPHEFWLQAVAAGITGEALVGGLEEVRRALESTGYPTDRCRLVKGKVEDTIPGAAPDRIALLRLDTDWYESTRHELEHLFPRLSSGGVLILDDYAYFRGAKKATDEYFQEHGISMLLHRVDAEGYRIGVKR